MYTGTHTADEAPALLWHIFFIHVKLGKFITNERLDFETILRGRQRILSNQFVKDEPTELPRHDGVVATAKVAPSSYSSSPEA